MFRRRFLRKKDSGLSFTDQSTSQMTAAQASLSYVKTVSGEYSNTVNWQKKTSNIYSAFTDSGSYTMSYDDDVMLLIAEKNGDKYAIGSNGETVLYRAYIARDTLDNYYKWTRVDRTSTTFDWINNATGEYAYVNSEGHFAVQSEQPTYYFTTTRSGLLSFAYVSGAYWVPYRSAQNRLQLSTNVGYIAKIYKCSYSGNNFTLEPVKDENGTLSGANRVLVVKDSDGKRYIVGITSTGGMYTTSAITMKDSKGNTGTAASDDDTLTFSNSSSKTTFWPRFIMTVSGMNGTYQLKYQYSSYTRYLSAPTGNPSDSSLFVYSMNPTASSVKYDDTHGVFVQGAQQTGPFGIDTISQGFITTDYSNNLTAGGTAILYQKSGDSWSPYYGKIQAGGEYAIVVIAENEDGGEYYHALYPTYKRKWETTGHTYFANGTITSNDETIFTGVAQTAHGSGYDLTVDDKYIIYDGGLGTVSSQPDNYWTVVDGELVWNYSTTTEVDGVEETTWNTRTFGVTESHWELASHLFSTLAEVAVTDDCAFTASQGTNGFTINYSELALNVNNNALALLSVGLEWEYMPNSSTHDNSRLWSVTTQSTNYYPEYANSDLEANTQATDTTCDIFLVQNGKVQIQADEFVDGETYVLVFVDGGNHYAACVNGTDIVPVLYANSLPKNLPSDYHFVAEASGQGFILKHNNQAMGVAVNTKLTLGYSAVWTYTGGTNE